MGTKTIIVCVAENEYQGRLYLPGEWYEGPMETAPVDRMGWAQREPLACEAAPNTGEGSSGRNTIEWRPVDTVEVAPVIIAHDVLRDEDIIDEAATRAKQLEMDLVRRGFWPKPTKEEHWKRHLAYLQWAAPEQYEAWIADHPEDSLGGTPPATDALPASEPVAVELVVQIEQEEVKDLDELLKAEAQAEADGDLEKLDEIRSRIEAAMK